MSIVNLTIFKRIVHLNREREFIKQVIYNSSLSDAGEVSSISRDMEVQGNTTPGFYTSS